MGVNNRKHLAIDFADRDDAFLAVVAPIIDCGLDWTVENQGRRGEIKTAFAAVSLALRLVHSNSI